MTEAAKQHLEVLIRVPIHLLKNIIMDFIQVSLKLGSLTPLSEIEDA